MKTALNRCPHCWSSLPESVDELCLHCGRQLEVGRRRRERTKAPAETGSVVPNNRGEEAKGPANRPYQSPWDKGPGTATAPPATPAPVSPPAPLSVDTPAAVGWTTVPVEERPLYGEPKPLPEQPLSSPAESETGPVRRSRRPLIVALVLALVASASGVAGWQLTRPDGPSYPNAWDPRVIELVDFVEREHDLRFRHPVYVDFLPEAEFRDIVTEDEANLSDEDRRDIEAAAGMLRALGLVDGDVDLFEAVNQLTGEGVLAYYDLETERIRVRGTELTMMMRGTLVHELTHALQDQVFDLGREFPVQAQNETFQPVYEGDAERIASAWVATLSEGELLQYQENEQAEADGMDTSGVPEALSIFFGAPYQLGEPFISLVVKDGGERAVDEVLTSPPHSDAELFDPFRYLLGEGPAVVDEPGLSRAEKRTDGGPFGAFGLFVILAQQLDAHQALATADAWGGDAYVTFERDGRQCVRAAFTGKDPAGTGAIGDALEAWAAAMPGTDASVARNGDLVELNSCDPGSAMTTPEPGRLASALTLPIMRSYMGIEVLGVVDSKEIARCTANHVVTSMSLAELEQVLGEGPTEAFLQRSFEAGQACAAGGERGVQQVGQASGLISN